MSAFEDLIDEYLGDADAMTDIRATVRYLWLYDFVDYPLYVWQGKGKLHTTDGNTWLGTIDPNNRDHHITPTLQDGRDGSSGTYEMSLNIPDLPGQSAFELYQSIKADQWRIEGQTVTVYLVVVQEGEGLRPQTPAIFFKELSMMSCKFNETLQTDNKDTLIRSYQITLVTKDINYGRTNRPNGTYADTIQKQRARELGVSVDKGSEFLAALANRTYTVP